MSSQLIPIDQTQKIRLKSLEEADLENKRVLVRVDYNLSLDKNGQAKDATKVTCTLPTINYLLEKKASIILVSHLGRPKGKVDPQYSIERILGVISQHLHQPVTLIKDINDPLAFEQIKNIKPGEIFMLENIRFYPEENANDPDFAKKLASFAEVYINDAFASSHRAHASTVGVTQFLPSYAGFLLIKEIEMIKKALDLNKNHLVIIIGGAKTTDKIRVIDRFLDCAQTILVGGIVANTFLAALGVPLGCSLYDSDMLETTRQIIIKAMQSNCSLILPVDFTVSDKDKNNQPQVLAYNQIPQNLAVYDIGPETRKIYHQKIGEANTVIWSGPVGLFEDERFSQGTNEVLESMSQNPGTTIIAGGDTLKSLKNKDLLKQKITHVSTGGGAALEFLEKGTLPALEVLQAK